MIERYIYTNIHNQIGLGYSAIREQIDDALFQKMITREEGQKYWGPSLKDGGRGLAARLDYINARAEVKRRRFENR